MYFFSINFKTKTIMKNYFIKLTENKENGYFLSMYVNRQTLTKLEENQTHGGFLRYHIDIYDDNLNVRANSRGLAEFYHRINLFY